MQMKMAAEISMRADEERRRKLQLQEEADFAYAIALSKAEAASLKQQWFTMSWILLLFSHTFSECDLIKMKKKQFIELEVHLWFKMFVHGLILQVILSMMKLETLMKCSLNHIPYTHCEDEFLLLFSSLTLFASTSSDSERKPSLK